jgi:hypothetical protein
MKGNWHYSNRHSEQQVVAQGTLLVPIIMMIEEHGYEVRCGSKITLEVEVIQIDKRAVWLLIGEKIISSLRQLSLVQGWFSGSYPKWCF